MTSDPHSAPGSGAPPPPERPEVDHHVVVDAGAPLDLASGTVEALLARAPVVGAAASAEIVTMHPWNLPQPQHEEVDGVEEDAGP